jgi:hypothetical protein
VLAGTISGRVSNAEGEPLAGIDIRVLRPAYDAAGKSSFESVGTDTTNDRGEYRVYWIAPGRYFVAATVPPSGGNIHPYLPGPGVNQIAESGYPLTYYAGTTDQTSATVIVLQPGAEISTIDFTLRRQPVFRIRGRLVDTGNERPASAWLSLVPRNSRIPRLGLDSGARYIGSNDTFEFRDILPGSYWIRASGVGGSAREAVDVSNADVENIVLTLTHCCSIKGRIVLEEPASIFSDDDRPQLFLNQERIRGELQPDGTFTAAVLPGDYHLSLSPLPPNIYIKAVRLGSTDVLNGFSIRGPVSGLLEIVLGTKAGQIDGTIVDRVRNPMRGIHVILMPARQADRVPGRVENVTSDQNGRFAIRAIPPGDYKLFAWEDLEPNAYYDSDFVRKYETLGTPIQISENMKQTVEIKIIPADQ